MEIDYICADVDENCDEIINEFKKNWYTIEEIGGHYHVYKLNHKYQVKDIDDTKL
jgi:hypothetical protein